MIFKTKAWTIEKSMDYYICIVNTYTYHAFAVLAHRCTDEGVLHKVVSESLPQERVGREEVLQQLIVAYRAITVCVVCAWCVCGVCVCACVCVCVCVCVVCVCVCMVCVCVCVVCVCVVCVCVVCVCVCVKC